MTERFWETPTKTEATPDFEKMTEAELLESIDGPADIAVRKIVEKGDESGIEQVVYNNFDLSDETADFLIECGYANIVVKKIHNFKNLKTATAERLITLGFRDKVSIYLSRFSHLQQIREYADQEIRVDHWKNDLIKRLKEGRYSLFSYIDTGERIDQPELLNLPEVRAAARGFLVQEVMSCRFDVDDDVCVKFRNLFGMEGSELTELYKDILERWIQAGELRTAQKFCERKNMLPEISHDPRFEEALLLGVTKVFTAAYTSYNGDEMLWDKLGGNPEIYKKAAFEAAKNLLWKGEFQDAKRNLGKYIEPIIAEKSEQYLQAVKMGLFTIVGTPNSTSDANITSLRIALEEFAPTEYRDLPELKKAAIIGLEKQIAEGAYHSVSSLVIVSMKDLITLTKLGAEDVQEAISKASSELLKRGRVDSFILVCAELGQKEFAKNLMKQPEQQRLLQDAIVVATEGGRWQRSEFNDALLLLEDKEFVNSERFQEVAVLRLSHRMYQCNDAVSSNLLEQLNEFIAKANLSEEKVAKAAVNAVQLALDARNIETTVYIQKKWNVPIGDIQKHLKKAVDDAFMSESYGFAVSIFSEKSFKLTISELADPIKLRLSDEIEKLSILRNIDIFPENVLQSIESEFFLLSYRKDLDIPSVKIYNEYLRLKKQNDDIQLRGYVEGIKSAMDALISSKPQDQSISQAEHYEELIELVYPNHSNNWTNFEKNESCADRSSDLDGLNIKPVYKIDLSDGVEMKLRDNQKKDQSALASVEAPIKEIQTRFTEVGFEKEKMFKALDVELDNYMKSVVQPELFKTREEKIFALVLESLVGRFDTDTLKEVLIGYQFAEFEDIRGYIEGTRSRSEISKNPDYVYLLELREFFADHVKDVQRKIFGDAIKNPAINDLLPKYYDEKRMVDSGKMLDDKLNRLQINKLGLEAGLLDRVLKEIKKKTDKKGGSLSLVETDGDGQLKLGKRGQAIAGMIGGEQKKVAQALEVLTGEKIDPDSINLDEINLRDIAKMQTMVEKGEYDGKLFSKYLTQAFQSIFEKELTVIDREIGKFEPKEEVKRGKQMRTVEGYITKNHTSAHARGVGGVCVSGDNPEKSQQCIWNMPNYMQMVLRDAETKICQGLILLHLHEDQGKKILTASFNPSSTYIFKVDEHQLFDGLLAQLADFASSNGIDIIAVSQNKQIRTNRTGGEFEKAMTQAIMKKATTFSFTEDQIFAYYPTPIYKQNGLDVVWSRE